MNRGDSRCGVAAAALAVATVLGGCAAMGGSTDGVALPSASVPETLSPGWESRFKLEWKVAPESGATRTVDGYLYNEYGSRFRVRLQLMALDQSGAVVWRGIKQLPGEIPSFGRDYFQFRNVPAADQYRVTVFSFDTIEFDGGHEPH